MIMGILDKLKERGKREFGNFFETDSLTVTGLPLWTFPSGKGVRKVKIRILPPTKAMDEDPFVDFWAHYNLGNSGKQQHICLKKFAEAGCPVCDVLWALKDTDDSAHFKEVFRKLKAGKKSLVHALVDDESFDGGPEIPTIALLSSSMVEKIVKLMVGEDPDEDDEDVEAKPGLGDITHWKTGRWIVIKRNENPKTPNDYYSVLPTKTVCPIAKSKAKIKEILSQRVDLNKLIEAGIVSYETMEAEAQRIQRVYGDGDTADEEESVAHVKRTKKRKRTRQPDESDDLQF